jgi:hypothetical protein
VRTDLYRAGGSPTEPLPPEEPEDMIIAVPLCHEDDPVKVPGDLVGEVACPAAASATRSSSSGPDVDDARGPDDLQHFEDKVLYHLVGLAGTDKRCRSTP